MFPAFFATASLATRRAFGPRELAGTCGDVAFEATRQWWGRRWAVTSVSDCVVPEPMLVFASRKGMEHGFWRDFRIGDAAFDREHFVYSDTPALLPLVIGPETRKALGAPWRLDDALSLYIRGGVCRVTGTNDGGDDGAIDRHLAVHRGLVHDHGALLGAWKELVGDVHGRADATWPPVGVVMTPVGGLRVFLRWTPATDGEANWGEREDSLRTVVAGNDGRARAKWSVKEAYPAGDGLFAGRYAVAGKPPLAQPLLEQIIARTGFTAFGYSSETRISVRGVATRAQLAEMVRAIEAILEAPDTGSPYR